MPEHGSLYSKDLRLYGHGQSVIKSDLKDAKEHIKRHGWTSGTIQNVNAYLPLDSEGKESHNLPLVWVNQGEPRKWETTKRGAFKWSDSLVAF